MQKFFKIKVRSSKAIYSSPFPFIVRITTDYLKLNEIKTVKHHTQMFNCTLPQPEFYIRRLLYKTYPLSQTISYTKAEE
jgi:hypothetical protein